MYEDDDVSDLTEISDEEYGAPKSNKKSSSKTKSTANATGGFRIKNALKVPRPTTYTVQALYGAFLILIVFDGEKNGKLIGRVFFFDRPDS